MLSVVNGVVRPNAWAFLPVYPFLVKALTFGNVDAWPVAAVLVSPLCGLGASILLGRLVAFRLHHVYGTPAGWWSAS